jgi:hypothetical protein
MRGICWMHRRALLWWVLGLSLSGTIATSAVWAACANTPAGAAAGLKGANTLFALKQDGGFRVQSLRWDPVLRQRWALVVSCAHPEWPAIEIVSQISDGATLPSGETAQGRANSLVPLLPVMRAGDEVQLWSQEGDLRIEVAALAEQNGSLGKTIRLRLMRRETLGSQVQEQFYGIVRGPHNVEMQR